MDLLKRKPDDGLEAEPSKPLMTVNQAKAEKYLIELQNATLEIKEFFAMAEEELQNKTEALNNYYKLLNSLLDSINKLDVKIKAYDNFESYLEEKVKNNDLSREVLLLEQHLERTQTDVSVFMKEIKNSVESTMADISIIVNNLKSEDQLIEDKLASFNSSIIQSVNNEMEKMDESIIKIKEDITQWTSDASKTWNVETETLFVKTKKDIGAMLSDFQNTSNKVLVELQDKSVSFLKTCSVEYRKLIDKIPGINTKLSKVDKVQFIMLGILIFTQCLFLIF